MIDPLEALAVIRKAHHYVRFWKVGKLNHMKEYEQIVNWRKFLYDAETLLKKYGANYYIKNDLQAFAMEKKANSLVDYLDYVGRYRVSVFSIEHRTLNL